MDFYQLELVAFVEPSFYRLHFIYFLWHDTKMDSMTIK